MIISLCAIATRNYKQLVQPLLDSVNQYFLTDYQIVFHLFTDVRQEYVSTGRIIFEQHLIPSWGFPEATLFRYAAMYSMPRSEYGDYVFYVDCDSSFVAPVGDEILAPIVATLHPGYYNGGGSWETNEKSLAYIKSESRKKYWCGGFQGGSTDHYYAICRLLKERINADTKNGVKAIWDDESHFNWFLAENGGFLSLTPEYMMPEPVSKRVAWGINHFEPKILALEKPKNFRV